MELSRASNGRIFDLFAQPFRILGIDPTATNEQIEEAFRIAEQIRRVRGFDQLFVISHDDSFEQGLDSLIRLRKMDNKTAIMTEDDGMMVEEQVRVHAS